MIELIGYTVPPEKAGNGLYNVDLSLSKGEICALYSDSSADAALLLKALSTLAYPISGTYRFMDEALDFEDYRSLLPVKKRIGYIGQDAAMISNMSVRENLLLQRYYYENTLQLDIDEKTRAFCLAFKIEDELDLRPGRLMPSVLRLAIVIRELSKSPDLLFFEYPEEYVGHKNLDLFAECLKGMPLNDMGIVFISENDDFRDMFANRYLSISNGCLNPMAPPPSGD